MKGPKTLSCDPARSAVECARTELAALVEHYFAAGRKAVKRRSKPRALHAFRIETKRFRYTLELFQPLYGPGLARRLEMLKQIQQHLGEINDCAFTAELVRQTASDGDAQKVLERLVTRQKQRTRKLVRYWQQVFDVPGAEQAWARYLRAWAGRGAAAASVGALEQGAAAGAAPTTLSL
jgi:CHAD domain-containing protein